MKALQYQRPRKIKLVELPDPKPEKNEIIVKVSYSGLCGTDLHILAEEAPAAKNVVLGHEFSGVVTDIGSKVKLVKKGERVAVNPNNQCGYCSHCLRGQYNFCQNLQPIGIRHDGGWAEYCAVPQNQAYILPEKTDFAWGALAEPLSCIIHGWERIKPITKEDSILIIGAGIIGILWRLVLQHFGMDNVQMIEPHKPRRNIIRDLEFGITKPKSLYKNETGYDVIIDCSGNISAIEKALTRLNPLGKFLFFGIAPQQKKISIRPFQIFEQELTLIGSVINPGTFPQALKIMNHIQIPPEKLGIHFFALDEYKNALAAARNGSVTKAMFKVKPDE
jgi:threonine dehydrogenase-like Zn-dependent dehydrogenase